MHGFIIVRRAIEGIWKPALLFAFMGAAIVAAHRTGLPAPDIFRDWVGWALASVLVGIAVALLSGLVHAGTFAYGAITTRAQRRAQQRAAEQSLALARRNLATLSEGERLLLADAMKRHPYHVEVPEFGPSQLLISKQMLCVVGDGRSTHLVCKVHPWLALHRDELIADVESN